MAALRQLLNARAMVTSQEQERSSPSPTEDEQRRNEKTMNYSNPPPAVPSKSQSTSKASPEQPRQLHSKYSEVDIQAWQHPLHRKGSDLSTSYTRGNSIDQGNSFARPAPLRSQTEVNMLSVDGSELDRSSFYEENESPALSPALNRHLALRPLNTQSQAHPQEQQQQQSYGSPQKTHTRRRSRSAAQDGYYGASEPAWDGYGVKGHKPRQSSLKGVDPMLSDPEQSSAVMQLLRDRHGRTPQPEQIVRATVTKDAPQPPPSSHHLTHPPPPPQSRFEPQPLEMIGAKQSGGARKEAHTFTNASNSPTDSATSTASPTHTHTYPPKPHPHPHKRRRSLDYTPHQLAQMDYSTLRLESFDHIPPSTTTTPNQKDPHTHALPAPTLPLPDRLRTIYPDKTHKDKAHRARLFFASLPIDQYDECGDLLLDGFKDIMERLKLARGQKRKAARAMEEEVARREEWGRRKRGVLEVELGRLRGAGRAVVKPVGKGGRGKGSL